MWRRKVVKVKCHTCGTGSNVGYAPQVEAPAVGDDLLVDAHDALMDERSESRYDGPDDREREEADRYRALMYGAQSLAEGTNERG